MKYSKAILYSLILSTIASPGCGPSKKDLMMRAAMRQRDDASESGGQAEAATTPAAAATPPGALESTADSAEQAAAPAAETTKVVVGPESSAPTAEVMAETTDSNNALQSGAEFQPAPISTRTPPSPLEEFDRRKRSATNLKQIGIALKKYLDANSKFPARGTVNGEGTRLLSWRVELLPFLGYDDLYRQFDLTQAWNSPRNAPLLDRIPDCYVSPERFDTKTNYLALAGPEFVFQNVAATPFTVNAGLDNTLAVVEVIDQNAVPWTCPTDYEPTQENPKAAVGGLRMEGIYGIWANGQPTVFSDTTTDDQLFGAFTCRGGDGFVRNGISKNLTVEGLMASGQFAFVDGPVDRPVDGQVDDGPGISATAMVANNESLARLKVPARPDIAQSMDQVKQLYEERLKRMGDRAQIETAAQEMLQSAATMRNDDPSGAYALQSTVVEIAIRTGNFQLLVKALEGHVAMFEVDALKLYANALLNFGKQNGGAMASVVDSRAYLDVLVPVIYGLLVEDSHEDLEKLVQYAIAYETRSGNRLLAAELNRLRSQVSSARNYFNGILDATSQLQKDAEDPAASFAVGRYVTFIKGDWENGLPMLAVGNNEKLAQMAKADLATEDADPERMLSTADAWWDLGEQTNNELFKGACRARAAYWYQTAIALMPDSLLKLHARARLNQVPENTVDSPMTAVLKLGEALGFDVRMRLLTITDPSSQVAPNANDGN